MCSGMSSLCLYHYSISVVVVHPTPSLCVVSGGSTVFLSTKAALCSLFSSLFMSAIALSIFLPSSLTRSLPLSSSLSSLSLFAFSHSHNLFILFPRLLRFASSSYCPSICCSGKSDHRLVFNLFASFFGLSKLLCVFVCIFQIEFCLSLSLLCFLPMEISMQCCVRLHLLPSLALSVCLLPNSLSRTL